MQQRTMLNRPSSCDGMLATYAAVIIMSAKDHQRTSSA